MECHLLDISKKSDCCYGDNRSITRVRRIEYMRNYL